MIIKRAKNAGPCYGVQRAIDMAESAAESATGVYTLGPLIHNPGVVADLKEKGVGLVHEPEELDGGTVIIRSHGVTPDVRARLAKRGLEVVDATCPHVARAQKGAAELAAKGCRVIVVGEEGHPEVEGLKQYAKRENMKVDVVLSKDDVPSDLHAPIGVVVQTTQTRDALESVLEGIRAQGIEPIVKNTICSATRLRQDAARELAQSVDAIVVVGGRNSSNTTRLAEICAASCPKSYHVESVAELDRSWFEGCSVVGVTAGASTPESQIEAVVQQLRDFG